MADVLDRPFLHHHKISRFFEFQVGDRPPSRILKNLKKLTAVQFRDMLCIILPNVVKIGHSISEISQFFAFYLVKCKTLLNNRTYCYS